MCFTFGKSHAHPQKECKRSKKRPRHCLNAVQQLVVIGKSKKKFILESLNLKMEIMAKVQTGVMIGGGSTKYHMLMLSKKMLQKNQADNDPWKPIVGEKNETDSYDDNRAFKKVKSQVVNTTVTPVSNSGRDVNIKHRNVDGKPILKHKTNSKVRLSKSFTNKPNNVGFFKGNNDIHSPNNQSLSPVVNSNRFWPLIDVMNGQEGKVVVHESKCV